jgi:predicted GNAT family acetyltransferase
MSVANPVVDNVENSRFELTEQGLTAFADYVRRGQVLLIPHVEAPIPLRGTGTAGRLMQGLTAHVRAQGLKLAPLCPYAAAWLRRHPEHGDLVV